MVVVGVGGGGGGAVAVVAVGDGSGASGASGVGVVGGSGDRGGGSGDSGESDLSAYSAPSHNEIWHLLCSVLYSLADPSAPLVRSSALWIHTQDTPTISAMESTPLRPVINASFYYRGTW